MSTTLDYLIDSVRMEIGDYATPYRYLDDWIFSALTIAVKKFQRYSKSKYLIDADNLVTRSPYSIFETDESSEGTIEKKDEPILIVLAAIIILEGSLENSAWNTVSWKDAEISFSNLESGRLRNNNLDRLVKELDKMILPPTKRLATSDKQSLPGYRGNSYEHSGDY